MVKTYLMCMANLVSIDYLVTPVTGSYINIMLSNGLDLMHVCELIPWWLKRLVFFFRLRVNKYFWNLLPLLPVANELIKDEIQCLKAMYIIPQSIHLCVFVFWHNACTASKMRTISLHFSYAHSFMFFFLHMSFLQLSCHCECNANADCCSNLIVTNKIICILSDYG